MELKTSFSRIDHFDACKRKRKQINKQSTISEMFGKKRRIQTVHLDEDDQNLGMQKVTSQVELAEVDSDLDLSDVEDHGEEHE